MSILNVFMTFRTIWRMATVLSVTDKGSDQLLDVQIGANETRSKIPVHQLFGFNSSVPLDGAITHVLAVGGDPSHLIALPPYNPIKGRFGGLKEGETVLYDSIGQRLHFQDGKICRVDVVDNFQVGFGPNDTVLNVRNDGVDVTGDLTVSKTLSVKEKISTEDAITAKKDITSQGDVKSREVSLQKHTHKTTTAPANGPTSPPLTSG